ncbi:AAA family ATPase [Actinosynnema sp. NPDC023587]|uniref:AAA family ATPase n=1 Tax=Actinosynnema sp. NPDC023587 TaxID=3154695 RepID=UPI00340EE483
MLFGRAAELRTVARWLSEIAGHRGSVLGVVGEMGAGKTAVSRFAAATAERRGFRVLHAGGSPYESTAAGQLVRRLCGAADREELHRRVLAESRSTPVLVVVDDLHWSDPESLTALAFLARRVAGLPVGLLVCRLPGGAAGDPVLLAELFRDLPAPARVELGALADAAADEVITATLPAAPPAVRADLRRWTGNNPNLLGEVLSVLVRWGERLPEVSDAVPAGVSAWLLRQLGADLPVARALAVLPADPDPEALAALAELPVFAVGLALGRLVGLGLVRPGRPAFRQPVVRAALLDAMPPAERVRLVLAGAGALRRAGADGRDLVAYLLASRVADHPAVGEPLVRVVRSARPADRAGLLRTLLAHRLSAPARAEFLRLLAAEELDRSPTAALARLDEAARLAGDRRSFAFERARALHRLDRGGEAARVLQAEPWSERRDALLAVLVAEDPELAVAGGFPLRPARSAGTPAGWAVRAAAVGDVPPCDQGPLRSALVCAQRVEELLAAARLDDAATTVTAALALLSAVAGRDRRTVFVAALPPLVDALVERNGFDTATRLLASSGLAGALPARLHHVALLASRGRLRHASGDVRGAVADLLRCGRQVARWGERAPHRPPWRVFAVPALLDAGRRTAARALAEAELAQARDPADRARGLRLLGQALGGVEGVRLLAEATSGGVAGLEGITALGEHGRLLARVGRVRAARARLKDACLLAEKAGAWRLRDLFAAELRESGGRVRGTVSGPGALTAGERRAARLAAAGRTNREIAEQLFVTRRAVEMHLTQVYRKLGIAGRRELAGASLDSDSRGRAEGMPPYVEST